MKQLELVIRNQTGLHARPAKVLVNLAKQFKSDIRIQCKDKRANAKSMVSVLTLGADLRQLRLHRGQRRGRGAGPGRPGGGRSSAASATRDGPRGSAEPRRPPAAPEAAPGAPRRPPGRRHPGHRRPRRASPWARSSSTEPTRPQAARDLDAAGRTAGPGARPWPQAKQQLAELHARMVGKKLERRGRHLRGPRRVPGGPGAAGRACRPASRPARAPARAWQDRHRGTGRGHRGPGRCPAVGPGRRPAGRGPPRPAPAAWASPRRASSCRTRRWWCWRRELSPSETAAFDPERVLGFCIVNGGPTSHIAILARALGLPAVVGAESRVLELAGRHPGHPRRQRRHRDPGSRPRGAGPGQAGPERPGWSGAGRRRPRQALPAVTLDGRHVDVTANVGSPRRRRRGREAGRRRHRPAAHRVPVPGPGRRPPARRSSSRSTAPSPRR